MRRNTESLNHVEARGASAAYGRRRGVLGALITWFGWKLHGVGRRLSSGFEPDWLEFVPAPRTATELADLSARVSWYLADRTLPIHAAVPGGPSRVRASDAPWMDPELVRDPGWEQERPAGRPYVVVHRVTPRAVYSLVRARGRGTIASPTMSIAGEDSYFDLHASCGSTSIPTASESATRLLQHRVPGGAVLVLATGPSAQDLDRSVAAGADVRITCNSAVRDVELLEWLQPNVITFSDRVFHFGPSRYAAAFRKDLERAMTNTDATILTSRRLVGPLLASMPHLRDRVAVAEFRDGRQWGALTRDDFSVRGTGNVLTNLMLPAAFALGSEILIAGCDGRLVNERYFWRHNQRTQYTDQLMQSAFQAHPAFFRDRDYDRYYEQHCDELEEFLAYGESKGLSVRGVTGSHIPALLRRGAPPLSRGA